MEIEFQDDSVLTEAEISPAEQLRQQWKQQPGFIAFLRQKNVIDENAELLPYAGVLSLPGWASPRAFAFQGLVLIAILLSFLNWYETRDRGKLQEDIVTLQANVAAENKRQLETMDAVRAEKKRISASPKSIVWKNVPREEALQQIDTSLEDSQKSLKEYQTKMAQREKELRDHMYIKSSSKFFKVNFSEIVYIEGMKDYLKICTNDSKLVTHQTMSEMEKLLPVDQFIRVHKSYIVSMARIKSIYGNNIETTKLTIPIGVNYKEKVMQLTGRRFS